MKKTGNIVQIEILPELFAYAINLESVLYGFYNYFISEKQNDLEKIIDNKIAIMDYALSKENWQIIGNTKVPNQLASEDYLFSLQNGDSYYTISLKGKQEKSNYESVKNLEVAAVWDPEHAESRLLDLYGGNEDNNKWLKSLSLNSPNI